ncbi:AfsR/SARP family transcriptional regulator [Longibaculum muris]|uniref:AfsR/SARP family transcriptional regulator n=1 Tax=Longibaculum muris TaxID=1796628 RepID=UPI003AB36F7A
MKKGTVLNVYTLGKLKISCGDIVFPLERQRSAQVELLIIYLILNRDQSLNATRLIDFLWPKGNSDKPEGALRNLVYRARKEMKRFCDDISCIQSLGKGYNWNLEVECKVDYEDLVKLANRIQQEKDVSKKYSRCLRLLEKYVNQFLPEFLDNPWVEQMNRTLHTHCLEAFIDTLDCLLEAKRYEDVLKLTEHLNAQQFSDTKIYEARLYSYYKTNQIDAALAYYRQNIDTYFHQKGIPMSARMTEIYQLILNTIPSSEINVVELEDNLVGDNHSNSTFYCDFDVFKNIYQVNLRSAKRSMDARVLALLTLSDSKDCLSEQEVLEEVDILRDVIAKSLRKNDVFSKFNMTQFALIVASHEIDGASIAVERIQEEYNKQKKHPEMILKSELKKIF